MIADILRYNVIIFMRYFDERFNFGVNLIIIILTNTCNTYFLIKRWLGGLFFIQDFLIEFLSIPQSSILNFHAPRTA